VPGSLAFVPFAIFAAFVFGSPLSLFPPVRGPQNRNFDQFRPTSTNFDRKKISGSLQAKHTASSATTDDGLYGDGRPCTIFAFLRLFAHRISPPQFVIRHSSFSKMVLFETKHPRVKMRRLAISNLQREKWYSTIFQRPGFSATPLSPVHLKNDQN